MTYIVSSGALNSTHTLAPKLLPEDLCDAFRIDGRSFGRLRWSTCELDISRTSQIRPTEMFVGKFGQNTSCSKFDF